jgi:hypothetical protein
MKQYAHNGQRCNMHCLRIYICQWYKLEKCRNMQKICMKLQNIKSRFFFLHSQDYAISILIELNKHIVITLNLLVGYYLAKRIFLTNQQLKKTYFKSQSLEIRNAEICTCSLYITSSLPSAGYSSYHNYNLTGTGSCP